MNSQSTKSAEREAYVQLRHIAAEIPVGTTENRQVCPFCQGGRNRDRGFSITRVSEAEAKYKCHRATCNHAGRIEAWGFRLGQEYDPNTKERSQFTPRLYTGNAGELGESWLSELLALYGLSKDEATWAGWREDIDSKRLICPIYGPDSLLRGYELRRGKSLVGGGVLGPKTSRYKAVDGTWVGWFRRVKTGPVLLVEDCISALKGSRHVQTASLLGSHLSLDHILEAIEVAGDNPIFLALDQDATNKAFKFISQWRFVAPNFKACPLSKDLKYLSDNEILKVIS